MTNWHAATKYSPCYSSVYFNVCFELKGCTVVTFEPTMLGLFFLLAILPKNNMWCGENSRWAHVLAHTFRLTVIFLLFLLFCIGLFTSCWWPVSVRVCACVGVGQSVKLGLAWSHDITGLRGLLASQQLLLLLFLSPHNSFPVSFRYQVLSSTF